MRGAWWGMNSRRRELGVRRCSGQSLRASWAFSVALSLFGLLACGNASQPPSPTAGDGASCGVEGQIITMGFGYEPNAPLSPPELEPLRGCKRFRGTLHLNPRDEPRTLEALTALEAIDGSLVIVSPPTDLSALGHLRSVGGTLILRQLYEAPRGLEALESAHGLWLYDGWVSGSFTDLEWLPKLTNLSGSFISRRNPQVPAATLEAFARERVLPGAWVSLGDSVPPNTPTPDADAVLCGQADQLIQLNDPSLAGCTRLLGSLHLPDVFSPDQLQNLSSLLEIDGSLSLFRNHTPDFSALGSLRRVGANFQTSLIDSTPLQGFENLREVGELSIAKTGDLTDFEWLPALTKVRELATIQLGPGLSEEAVTALVSRIEIGGPVLVFSP